MDIIYLTEIKKARKNGSTFALSLYGTLKNGLQIV